MKEVSDFFEGADIEFLRQCCRETLESHPDERIEDAISSYQDIVMQLRKQKRNPSV